MPDFFATVSINPPKKDKWKVANQGKKQLNAQARATANADQWTQINGWGRKSFRRARAKENRRHGPTVWRSAALRECSLGLYGYGLDTRHQIRPSIYAACHTVSTEFPKIGKFSPK